MNPFFNMKDLQGLMNQFGQPNSQGMPFNGFNIQKQVMDAVNQHLPDFLKQGQNFPLSHMRSHNDDCQVFETHDFVIVRIPIPDNGHGKPRISLSTHTLYIKDLPNHKDHLKIHLPCPIKTRHAKAEYRHGILEVRMLKAGPEPTTDITIDD
jgi:hypothetical protein